MHSFALALILGSPSATIPDEEHSALIEDRVHFFFLSLQHSMRMDVRVISLKNPSALLKQTKRMFPNANVAIQRGVDVRGTSVELLHKVGLVTHEASRVLRKGRKWHHELSTKGAVGLAQAVRLALEEDVSKPLLLLEDDCQFTDTARVQYDVEQLLTHMQDFDVASFGAYLVEGHSTRPVPYLSKGWYHLGDADFWMTHCVVFSPQGRRKVAEHLRRPLGMQIDALYSSLAHIGELKVFVQTEDESAIQSVHPSDIQDDCPLCPVHPSSEPSSNESTKTTTIIHQQSVARYGVCGWVVAAALLILMLLFSRDQKGVRVKTHS